MHIKVALVCWQGRKVEAQKSIIMKLIEKPGEFIWKHREDQIVAQYPCILDFSIIKGIKSPVLAPATNQCVHNMTFHLQKEINNAYNVHNANKCNNQMLDEMNLFSVHDTETMMSPSGLIIMMRIKGLII